MMSVKEYSSDTGFSVAEILKKCQELEISVTDAESALSEDDIIVLDNTLNLISTDEETSLTEEDQMDEAVENILEGTNTPYTSDSGEKKQKLKKRSVVASSKEEFFNKRKEMYKNKEKLQSNNVDEKIVLYKEGMSVADLAEALGEASSNIIKKLMGLGLMLNLNQAIDFENAEIIVLEYNKTLKKEETRDVSNFEEYEIIDDEADLEKRPPVVTIMGHVDHGKTSLLDYIRNTKVTDSEHGGITQHIGAYQVEHNDSKITFIDTPGHEAFTEMRARGASITDIVIIIVAADDGVMPQTKEAIEHALLADVPIIVAINKMDKTNTNPDRIMTEMNDLNITSEEWGGKYPFVKISAHTGEGIDLLLENIIATAEVKELKANPSRYAVGTVIESRLDKKIGGISTLLIQSGTLRLGDPLAVGTTHGKIRTMKNSLGSDVVEAGPSSPVEITGLDWTPSAGDRFMAFETESEAKEIAEKRLTDVKSNKNKKEQISLDDLFSHINAENKEINVILKADVRGSEEALKNALKKLEVEDIRVKVIRSGIGAVTESDVVLAEASNAIIIAFNVATNNPTKEFAKEKSVEIRVYTVIYKVIEEIEQAMRGLLDPDFEEKILGNAEVRQLFKFSKVGTIAGSYVLEGVVKQGSSIRVIRDGVFIHEGKIAGLQREKDTAKEVKKGFECGITLENYNDLKVGDIIEVYEIVEVKK